MEIEVRIQEKNRKRRKEIGILTFGRKRRKKITFGRERRKEGKGGKNPQQTTLVGTAGP